MKRLIGAAIFAATFALGGAFATAPAVAASSQPVAQHDQAGPLTDVSSQRRRHRHYRHRHYRPYYYAPRYYRPYYSPYYRPYYRPYYAPRPHFGFGFGFGPRYYW